jgi:hypothetical protein
MGSATGPYSEYATAQIGGYVPHTMPVLVHGGEEIVTAANVKKLSALFATLAKTGAPGRGQQATLNNNVALQVDGQTIARITEKKLIDARIIQGLS